MTTGSLHDTQTPLYPPTVAAPDGPLGLLEFIRLFPKNPLRGIPVQAYREDLFVYAPLRNITYVWVSKPGLVEEVLLHQAAKTSKTPLEKRVFETSLGASVLTADADNWRWQRKSLAPLFRHADLLGHVPAMAEAAESLVKRWRDDGPSTWRGIGDDMTGVTFDVLTRTLLHGARPDEALTIMRAGERYLRKASWEMTFALLRLPRWLPHPATWMMRSAARELRSTVGGIIDRRRSNCTMEAAAVDQGGEKAASANQPAGSAKDLLAALVAARHPDTGEPMPRETLIDNVATLLEAGHETTAKALTWTLYLLARAPRWQDRVREEIDAVIGRAAIKPAHIDALPVTRQVLNESMRLYPPAPVMARQVTSEFRLGTHHLKPGTLLVVPIYCIHRHRSLWEDPDRFAPERFEGNAAETLPRTQFMPFGAGPRICIGRSFAMIEMITLLASFVRAARFDWDGQHCPEPISRVTLRPSGGMPLKVTPGPR